MIIAEKSLIKVVLSPETIGVILNPNRYCKFSHYPPIGKEDIPNIRIPKACQQAKRREQMQKIEGGSEKRFYGVGNFY